MQRLHLVGIFHTLAQKATSHCAFTGKALRFAGMMQKQGFQVIEYSNESESAASEKVNILTAKDLPRKSATEFYGKTATIGSEWWWKFHRKLVAEMRKRIQPGDFICHPFGHAHSGLGQDFPSNSHIETGIGYRKTWARFQIFESYCWMHFHQGTANDGKGRGVNDYEWVVPNYFDINDWQPCYTPKRYILFFGRICPDKGLDVIKAIADHVTVPIVICGQGDPKPWTHKNIQYMPPVTGDARSALLGQAMATLMPTRFTEPFGGSGVEGLLCGTPLIASDAGAFHETVQPGVNGFRCHTLGDWVGAINRIGELDRQRIASEARAKYSLEAVGARYKQIFEQIIDLRDKGWGTLTPRNLPPKP